MQIRQWYSPRNWPLRIAVVFFAGCIGLFVNNRISPPGPRVACETPNVDLGVITHEDPVDSLFVIRNQGRAILRIGAAKTSCACTVVPFYSTAVQPGDSTVIPVRLDVKNHQGALKQYVVLTTNDPAHPQFALRLTADVEIASSGTALGAIHR